MNKLFEQLLKKRGFTLDFLNPKYEDLAKTEGMPDIEAALSRLILAKEKKEKIIIYGDYDVDGVTATAILFNALKEVGFEGISTMLPDRFIDGYGMSERLVDRVKKEKYNLVVTVDCGSNNSEIISQLKTIGADVIVTDHHEFSSDVPADAIAVVNPKRPDFREKNHDVGLDFLSGAGVAFMLAKALFERMKKPPGREKWLLDLAMIGTICDAMKLVGDNRIICYYGFIVLAKTRRVGLRELMKSAGIKEINSTAIGYQIGPRLNAAGRLASAELALELLTTDSKMKAAELAEKLEQLNLERKNEQLRAIREIEQRGLSDEPVIITSGKWSEGIVGIISGKLTEQYKKPSFVFTELEDGYKGSGRSFGDFNLAIALKECQDLIISGGGHAEACGVRLKKEGLGDFSLRINEYYRSLELTNQEQYLDVVADVSTEQLADLDVELVGDLKKLEPFGEGNKEPIFRLAGMTALSITRMGKEQQHLSILLRDDDGEKMKVVAFYAPEEWLELAPGITVDVWINLIENEWNGIKKVEGRILKISIVK